MELNRNQWRMANYAGAGLKDTHDIGFVNSVRTSCWSALLWRQSLKNAMEIFYFQAACIIEAGASPLSQMGLLYGEVGS